MTKADILAANPALKTVTPAHSNNGADTGSPCVIDGDYYHWSPIGSGVQIELHAETIRRISFDLMGKAALQASDDVGGLLVGQSSKTAPRTFRVMAVESCKSIQLHSVLTIVTNRMAPSNRGGSVLGFYRIADRGKLVFSDLDMYLALSRFAEDDKAFLLVEPSGPGRTRARFFYWNGTERGLGSELLEFPVVECGEGEAPWGWPQETQETALPALADEEDLKGSRRFPGWSQLGKPLLIGLVIALIAAAAVAAYVLSHRTPSQDAAPVGKLNSPLDLKITPEEGGMWLSWNTSAPVMATANTGLVTIGDGERKSQKILDREQLLFGKLFYISFTENVEFTVQFFGANTMQSDSVTALVLKPKREQVVIADSGIAPRSELPRQIQSTPPPVAAPSVKEPRSNTVSPPQGRSSIPASPVNASSSAPISQNPPAPRRGSAPPANQQQASPASPEPVAAPIPTQAAVATAPPQREPEPPRPVETPPATVPAAERRQETPPPPVAVQPPRTVPAAGPPQQPFASVSIPPQSNPVRTVPAQDSGRPPEKPLEYFGPTVVSQVKPTIPTSLNGLIKKDVLVEVRLSLDETGKVINAAAPPGEDMLYSSLAKVAVDTARRWRFQPARRGTRSEPSEFQLKFRFTPAR